MRQNAILANRFRGSVHDLAKFRTACLGLVNLRLMVREAEGLAPDTHTRKATKGPGPPWPHRRKPLQTFDYCAKVTTSHRSAKKGVSDPFQAHFGHSSGSATAFGTVSGIYPTYFTAFRVLFLSSILTGSTAYPVRITFNAVAAVDKVLL